MVRVGVALVAVCALMMVIASAAWSAGWTAYLTNEGSGTVTPVDIATNTRVTAITVGTKPSRIAITPDGNTAYVTNYSDNTITPFSTATNAPGAAILVGTNPTGVAITPDGTTAYVTLFGVGTVRRVDIKTNTPGDVIDVGTQPDGVAITPDGKTAYVTNSGDGTVTPISTATDTPGTPIHVGTRPFGVAITPDGKTAYVTNSGGGTVTPISVATNTPGPAIQVGISPRAIAITPDGQTAYVANFGNVTTMPGTVTPISTTANTPGPEIPVGTNPAGVAITPDGRTVYVTNFTSGTATPISTATNTPGTPIPVGSQPSGVVITPDQAPTATFTLAAGAAGTASSFEGSASSTVVGSIASYRWDFGDGQSATLTTPSITHVYAAAGTYTARLTVTDTAGTSLAQVFTGQTVSLQGRPQASTTRSVKIATAPTLNPTPTPTPAPTPAPALGPPSLAQAVQSHARWREGTRLATFAKHHRNKLPLGTTFSFRLNEPARVSFAFTQRAAGRKIKGRCVARTNTNRHKPSCRRTVTQGKLGFIGHADLNRVSFQGRISRTKKLTPGRYQLAIVATNIAFQHSTTRTLEFTIAK